MRSLHNLDLRLGTGRYFLIKIVSMRPVSSFHGISQLGSINFTSQEEVMTLERILLQTIKFDLEVEHPYTFLVKYGNCLKGDKARRQKMVQMAWTFVNDRLF